MSIYDELNDVKLDLAEYEEKPLTEIERKRWAKRIGKRLGKSSSRRFSGVGSRGKKAFAAAATALILIVGATLPAGQQALAKIPFMAGLLENFSGYGQDVDYSAYKSEIGETAENRFGKLTLNEVLVDANQLLITSTLEPSDDLKIEPDNVVFLTEKVTINGISDLNSNGGQGSGSSGENGTYTTFSAISFDEIPDDDTLDIQIEYDRLYWKEPAGKPTLLEEPWVFRVSLSRSALMAKTGTIEIGRTIELTNGDLVRIDNVISSPVSTTLHYEIIKQVGDPSESFLSTFKLVSGDGQEVPSEGSSGNKNGGSQARYAPIDLKNGNYSLIPYDTEKEKEMGAAVPIR